MFPFGNNLLPIVFSGGLKLIWDLLRGKDISGDDVIIEKSDKQAIINFLTKKIGEMNNVKQKKK